MRLLLLLAVVAAPLMTLAQAPTDPLAFTNSLPVVPRVQQAQPGTGSISLSATEPLVLKGSGAKSLAHTYGPLWQETLGLALNTSGKGVPFSLKINKNLQGPARAGLPNAAYSLTIANQPKPHISLEAADGAGFSAGLVSLFQLLAAQPIGSNNQISLPCVQINDRPGFAWRGMHLDVSRHFMPVAVVKRYIDLLALHKMNVFHWHLTDDQGWRIQIKKYPLLTQVGSQRPQTMLGHTRDKAQVYDGQPHGGFYTHQEIKEVVAYAAARHITVVPEIEMPGHAQAALAAYPQFGSTAKAPGVWMRWGVSDSIYSPAPATLAFLKDILGEVCALFPGPFVHIGGDEALKTQWKANPAIQAQMKELGLAHEEELQAWFIGEIGQYLSGKGKQLIGWDEILDGPLPANAIVMSWRGVKGGLKAASMGHDAIMTPSQFCYFDHYQGPRATEPLAIGGDLPVEKVYTYQPVPDTLSAQAKTHIIGAQGNVWTEYIATPQHLEYMVLPRLCALAEVVWTNQPSPRPYSAFRPRLEQQVKLVNRLGYKLRPLD